MRRWFVDKAGFENDHVFLFTDDGDQNFQPTGNTLKRFFRVRFQPNTLNIEDNLWFFFSGHGLLHEGQDYLMPSDGDPDPEGVSDTAISLSYVTQRLRDSGAGDVIIIYDACRDQAKAKGRGMEIEPQKGVITLASCSRHQRSYEIDHPQIKQGSFTYALLEALEHTRLGQGNYATFDRLYQQLKYRVPEINRQYGKPETQQPYGFAEPDEKRYSILLPKQATIQDFETYKKQALNAEVNNNLHEALRLLIRLWEFCPADPEVRQYYNRVIVKLNQQPPQTVTDKKSLPQPEPITTPSKSGTATFLNNFEETNTADFYDTSMQASTIYLQQGSLLKNGTYQIQSLLGKGVLAIVYKGIYSPNGAEIAIKEMWPSQARRQGKSVIWSSKILPEDKQDQITRFFIEANYQKQCEHPNIAQAYDWFEENNTAYMILQFIAGKSLFRILKSEGILSESRVRKYFIQVAEALKVIHRNNLQHRDIKPENILIDGKDNPILIDFTATREFITGQTKKMTIIFTPGYAPIEQYTSESKRYAATDFYACCASMYELLTGQRPVESIERTVTPDPLIPPRKLNPNISPSMEKIILTGMKMNIQDRFQTADDFIDALKLAS